MVSIIVPVYNAERFLDETVSCVQAQSYQKWELILVDDCSTDRSRELIREKSLEDPRIRLIEQKENGGAAKARNAGLSKAAGRYVCFLDADDIWRADKLEAELSYLHTLQKSVDREAGFVFTSYEFADKDGVGLGRVVHVPDRISYRQALKNTTIFTSTVMVDREKIPDEDIMMPCVSSEDTATWWQILKRHGTGYGLDSNLVFYRRSADTLSSNKLVAVKRIWALYRRQERLPVIRSAWYMAFWAFHAVARRM